VIKSRTFHSAAVLNFSHVLISRPEAESRRLAARVQAIGLQAVVMPAFSFRSSAIKVDPGEGWKQAATRLAIFTSPRSVEFGLPLVPQGMLDGVCIAALGPATATELETAGTRVDLQPPGPFTTEALLAMLEFPSGPGQAVIFAAPGGRQALQAGLEHRGWKVHMAMVYERVALEPATAETGMILTAGRVLSVWTSAAAMEWLLGRLPDDAGARVREGAFIVASERLARLARKLGVATVHVAAGADNPSLIHAIEQLTC
jgi:uroporphyrinogen-III synthase